MLLQIDKLGKVAVTVEESYWSNDKDYDKLTIVEAPKGEYKTYISRKPVPAGTVLTDRHYWIPFSSLKEEIVLDFNSFVNLWTENLRETNETINARIDNEVNSLNNRIDNEVEDIDNDIKNLQDQINSNDENIEELYNAVASVVAGGVALLQTFGNRTDFGISQKVLTESRDNLQAQIDAIVSDKATVSLTASTSTFIVGERTFTLTANANTNAENIVIKQGDNIIATGSGKTVSQTITVTQATAGSIVYTAEFTFAGGNKRSTTVTVYFVNKLYVGSGADYTDVIGDSYAQSARRNPAGTYNVIVAENAQYVFFVIPATMSISKATLSGFNFPLDAPVTETIDDVSYKIYRSSNTNDAGTYQIVIS